MKTTTRKMIELPICKLELMSALKSGNPTVHENAFRAAYQKAMDAGMQEFIDIVITSENEEKDPHGDCLWIGIVGEF